MSNFIFLKQDWPTLYEQMKKAEERVFSEPISTASKCRLVLEECIHHIFDLEHLELPYNKELVNLLNDEDIKNIIPFNHLNGLHIVRKTGNNAVHYGRRVNKHDAENSIMYLFGFLKWFANNYSKTTPELPAAFTKSFIPKIGAEKRQLKLLQAEQNKEQDALKAQIAKLLAEKDAILKKAEESEEALTVFKQSVALAKTEIKAQKQKRLKEIPSEFNEAQTRKHLIDISLKEAGWFDLNEGRELEFPVKGMPISADNPKGNGFVDYVLWDDNGKPLALVEAKRTTKDVEVGKHQAFLYANCIENMFGQRPIIFYTNGFETKIWNDTFYSTPRRVYGYYTKNELQWLIQQRNTRQDLRQANVNTNIAGRPYQIEAIQRVAESFITDGESGIKGNKRNALLVMATGSGKTRTAAALTEILVKNNWAKRVLFLADRNALVRQAKKNFGDHLPHLSSIDLTAEKENDTTRLVFSTYPSMLNKIDNARSDDERFYGVGHFDLIILDEAHRSIYNRYKSIFEYFDAMVVGLTATPKDSIDHNTFELFDCSTDDPTFNFDLEEATPTYLNPYTNIDVSTSFIRDGIKYDELSDEDKAKYEESFTDKTTGLFPEEIKNTALNKTLFNIDTVNKVLDALMVNGLKIEGGDKLGRTIIFAVNQDHAKFIVECFTKRYPDKPSGFIAMIHNKVSHAQSLIDSFCDEFKENNPQIAVSVDMMDTGIDAPRVLNLVFFKVVRSYAKFWQMVGRGTRLCADVFGPNQPKTEFLIFDVCQNFEFFSINKKGKDGNPAKPVTQQIFESRLQLSRLLAETGEDDNLELSKDLLDTLHNAVFTLDKDRFQVQMHARQLDEFKDRHRWNNLSANDVHQIEEHLSALPSPESINETARRFDLMMLKMQIANLLMLSAEKKYQDNVLTIAEELSHKYTIPQVLQSKLLIEELKNPDFYKNLKQKKINHIREELRDLVVYLEQKGQDPIYTNLQDSNLTVTVGEPLENYGSDIYKRRVERFIRENKDQLIISKLASNKPITTAELMVLENLLFDGDERGTKEDFTESYGEQPLGQFVRSIIGLDVTASNEAFSEFIQTGNFSADQMTFINSIINFLEVNGTIEPKMLFEAPFNEMHDQGVMGMFNDTNARKVIDIVKEINENAGVA